MLTSKQQATFGYRESHDLPTPPATTRPSPPSSYQDSYKVMPHSQRSNSPYAQSMSASHSRLPPPAAMGLQPQQPGPHQRQDQPPPPTSHQRQHQHHHSHIPVHTQPGASQHAAHLAHLQHSSHSHSQHGQSPHHQHPPSHSQAPVPASHHQPQQPQPQQQPPPPPPSASSVPVHSQSTVAHHHSQPQPQQLQPPSRTHDQGLGNMPAPPPTWQGSEESMRNWLTAKSEEEKRKQEEEKTRQETLRRDQRQIEFDILKASLTGGIPPNMIPLIFAGMGGVTLHPAQLEKAQQMAMGPLQHHGQSIPTSPSNRQDSQIYSTYPGTPGTGSQPHGFVHPGSPAGRNARGGAVAPSGRPLSAINTSAPAGAAHGINYSASQPSANSEPQSGGSSIYFHHWQPPSTNVASSSSTQPAAPSAESPKKRKAMGPPADSRSPPPFGPPTSGPSPKPTDATTTSGSSHRQGHSRQRSDFGTFRASSRADSTGSSRSFTPQPQAQSYPGPVSIPAPRDVTDAPRSGGGHSVSSLLSEDPTGNE